ncbi:RmlC-like cupin domain-containing protein [Microdochium trichocladiopsis]|uniref:RmlC-like cupin domain-containing protein n=1 Tax=Microdochium trichocladiopsis TaxID=1682393 RepID=A0A9P8Y989_9PEZI|nr:RmlC-like cupin domain-containing protein [Microdochium trichocladiopsis]KAH7031124.1 RmlC-like cupin domain-containing protein [Microdochium trichocladiopsis]
MQFTKITAMAILAYTAQAAPYWNHPGSGEHATGTTTSVYVASSTSSSVAAASSTAAPPAPAAPTGLSKTAQILLADTRVDGINNVLKDNKDFVFDFNAGRPAASIGKGGQIVAANRKTFPALTGQNIGMAVGFIGPCGFNTPHIHNRATELLIVTKGRVMSEMVIENGVNNAEGKPRNVANEIKEFQMTPFFQGSIHSQFNPDCTDAVFIAPQSNDDFGVSQVANNFLALNGNTISATFDNFFDGAQIDEFKSKVSINVALGVEECLKKCNISKRSL